MSNAVIDFLRDIGVSVGAILLLALASLLLRWLSTSSIPPERDRHSSRSAYPPTATGEQNLAMEPTSRLH